MQKLNDDVDYTVDNTEFFTFPPGWENVEKIQNIERTWNTIPSYDKMAK